jgi:hypothetical protein
MTQIPEKTIYIEQLEEMFSNIQTNTDWDTSRNMLWGYFFTHSEPTKLEKAKDILVAKGYRFVDIYLSDKDEQNKPDMFWLHLEKEETHSPQSLDESNNELYIFANEFGLDSYDGMDVGPVDK